jgi:hypothetical protein
MKKLILSVFVLSTFAACKSDLKTDTSSRDIQFLSDSTVYNNSTFSDTAVAPKEELIPEKAQQEPRVIVKTIRIHDRAPVQAPVYQQPAPVIATPPVAEAPSNTNSGSTASTGTASDDGAVATVPEAEKKKGWSKAAQGAAIGGVAGAVGGAIISKKKGLGAVVGAVVGAAGGYIIGKNKDKKENQFILQ